MKPLSTAAFFVILGIIYASGIGLWFYHEKQKEKETLAELSTREKILLVGNGGEPTSLDPAFAYHIRDAHIMHAIFECLLILDPKTLTPRPGVATDWDVSSDGLTYNFYLRDNARFSNGDPVTAHDFVFAVQRILSPGLKSPNVMFCEDIKNAKRYHEGIIHDFNEVGINALDNYTLQINLQTPNPYFSTTVAFWGFGPLHRNSLDKFNAVETSNDDWLRPENFVGNGPFVLKEWHPNDYIEVARNPYYWNASQVKLDKIRFYATNSPEEEAYAFSRGKLHVTSRLSSKHAATYAHRGDPCLRSVEMNAVDIYIFNTNIPPLDDARVRRALSMGIKRTDCTNDVINNVFENDRKVAYNFISDIVPGYRPNALVQEDIKQAQRLLEEAGFPNGKGFPQLQLTIPNDKTYIGVAKAVQDMWRRHLNIGIEIVEVEGASLWQNKFRNKDYHITRLGWISDNMDVSDGMRHFTRHTWQNPYFDRLLDASSKSPDVPTRFKYLAQAEAVLIDEAPIMPLFFHICHYLVHPDVQGWQTNALLMQYYQFIDLNSSNEKSLAENPVIPFSTNF